MRHVSDMHLLLLERQYCLSLCVCLTSLQANGNNLTRAYGTLFQYGDHLFRYGSTHCKDKRPSYLCNGKFCTGETASLYWNGPQNSCCRPALHKWCHGRNPARRLLTSRNLGVLQYLSIFYMDVSRNITSDEQSIVSMMMSSNGNSFCVTGPLCREFTGDRWIPLIKASDTKLWCFLWSAPE